MVQSQLGRPGFTLTAEESPLAILIKNLYLLLQTHYAAINFKELGIYAAAKPAPAGIAKPVDSHALDKDISTARDSRKRTKAATTVRSATTAPNLIRQPQSAGRRVLDTHDEILMVFEDAYSAWQVLREKFKGQKGMIYDKTMDQFLGMPEVVLAYAKGPTGTDTGSQHKSG